MKLNPYRKEWSAWLPLALWALGLATLRSEAKISLLTTSGANDGEPPTNGAGN